MSSEVKLTLQTDLELNTDMENFRLNLGDEYNNGKVEIFLSENDEFLINMFRANIDTSSQDVSYLINDVSTAVGLDVSSVISDETRLEDARSEYRQLKSQIKVPENKLDKTAEEEGGEDTPTTINLHVNFNENK